MSEQEVDYEDLTAMRLDDEALAGLLNAGGECVFNWTTRDGFPVGVVVAFVHRDGKIFTTCAERRKRVPALRARPQSGIVINNAIVLLDRIHTEIDENGLEPARAVVVAAQHRLRPILLTTGTTVGGLLPLWFGGGPLWEPMAITIIFGLVFATALTLGVVPLLYSALFRVRFRDFHY